LVKDAKKKPQACGREGNLIEDDSDEKEDEVNQDKPEVEPESGWRIPER
jgi:hypothetical protein